MWLNSRRLNIDKEVMVWLINGVAVEQVDRMMFHFGVWA